MNMESPWTVYRTRFLVQARQLTKSLVFTDALGREHSGQPGDYLVEFREGIRRIMPHNLFEDIYVPLHPPSCEQLAALEPTARPAAVKRRQPSSESISPTTWAQAQSEVVKGGLARSS